MTRPGSATCLRLLLPDSDIAASVMAAAQAAAQRGSPIVLTWRTYRALVDDLGSPEVAAEFLVDLVCQLGRPVLLNTPSPTGDGATVTQLIAPPGWTHEKGCGYLAGLKDELEREFGPVGGPPQPMRQWWAETRQQRRARERGERKRRSRGVEA
jgi:hypothetical protein